MPIDNDYEATRREEFPEWLAEFFAAAPWFGNAAVHPSKRDAHAIAILTDGQWQPLYEIGRMSGNVYALAREMGCFMAVASFVWTHEASYATVSLHAPAGKNSAGRATCSTKTCLVNAQVFNAYVPGYDFEKQQELSPLDGEDA
jgi:hypothetical protein